MSDTGETMNLCWPPAQIWPWRAESDRMIDEIDSVYSSMIAELAKRNADSLDWWVSSVASRNEYKDSLFHYCCGLVTLRNLLSDSRPPGQVLVDNQAMADVVNGLSLEFGETVIVTVNQKKRRDRWASCWLRCRLVVRFAWQTQLAKILVPRQRVDLDGRVLIDTYSLSGNANTDRYYGFLFDPNRRKRSPEVVWVPTIVGVPMTELKRHVLALRQTGNKVLLKEHCVALFDILSICLHGWRLRKIDTRCSLLGQNFGPVVSDTLSTTAPTYQYESLRALLNYYAIKCLASQPSKPAKIIDWFENQACDKAWNKACSDFLPDTRRIGYQGMYCDQPRYRPTLDEVSANVVPAEIATMGEALLPGQSNANDLGVTWSVAPAFRYQWLYEDTSIPGAPIKPYYYELKLPIETDTAIAMINMVEAAVSGCEGFFVYVHPHPASEKRLLSYCDSLESEAVKLADGTEQQYESGVVAVLCGGISTTVVESLAQGKPVIFLQISGYAYQTPQLQEVCPYLYSVATNSGQLATLLRDSVGRELDQSRVHDERSLIRDGYFSPSSASAIQRFLS